MLARIWSKGNPCKLLVGMQIGAATMENRMGWGVFEKLKIELSFDPAIPLQGIYPSEKNSNSKKKCSLMFIAALFTVLKI